MKRLGEETRATWHSIIRQAGLKWHRLTCLQTDKSHKRIISNAHNQLFFTTLNAIMRSGNMRGDNGAEDTLQQGHFNYRVTSNMSGHPEHKEQAFIASCRVPTGDFSAGGKHIEFEQFALRPNSPPFTNMFSCFSRSLWLLLLVLLLLDFCSPLGSTLLPLVAFPALLVC